MGVGGRGRTMLAACALQGIWLTPALGHASERGQIMLLPTELYMLGGGLAVFISVLIMALLPSASQWKIPSREINIGGTWPSFQILTSLISLAIFSTLVLAGFFGPSDPISNPLPGFVWSLWWVGFALVCLLLGNLWPLFNPWTGIFRIIGPRRPLLDYPAWLGCWPAVAMFFAFAWFELVYPAPDDPPRLATATITYLVVNFLGLIAFGKTKWMGKAEAFSLYFRIVGRLSPFQWTADNGKLRLHAGIPGHGLLRGETDGTGEAAFILLALATVSFDGLSQTFLWVNGLGLNPLEFPGRSAVVLPNTAGLILTASCLALAFVLATRSGRLGLVMSVVPIALAYHFAHYLADFPVDAMRALKALSDPFGTGLDLFGAAHINPPASIMMDHHVAAFIYRMQTAIIVIGHIMAVAVAHLRWLQRGYSVRATLLGQAPLNALMVLYTMFGLWLLSTPVIS